MIGGGVVIRIAGALVEARPFDGVALNELAYVGQNRLMAEIIRIQGDTATLQVFEDTSGVRLGEPVETTGAPLTALLGPGLLGALLDGVGRPLERVAALAGDFVPAGAAVPTLDLQQRWHFEAVLKPGDSVKAGDVIGTVMEREQFAHRILVPPGVSGRIATLRSGDFTVTEPVGTIEDGAPLTLAHRWPLRVRRPFGARLESTRPFITGQRVLDFFFPVAEGGSAAVPGGFGTGKTVVEHSLAKFAETDLVVYVGCGERGNEMAEVVQEFPKLINPVTGLPVMSRAVLVANTSNMPVAAREASIYLGITIAEYFRDMGYRAAVMIDSISRWAEALREIGARLQEMPAEEGYPTSLSARFGSFLERSGRVRPLGNGVDPGSVTIIGAISPPGGDFSEPVTQAALRVVGSLWALNASLAHERHFPAIDWEISYSLYADAVMPYFIEAGGADWAIIRRELMIALQRERELRDVAGLIGPESLADEDRLLMEIAAFVREIFLRQSAYDPNDATCSVHKTYAMANVAARLLRSAAEALKAGATVGSLDLGAARRALSAVRDAAESEVEQREGEALAVVAKLTAAARTSAGLAHPAEATP